MYNITVESDELIPNRRWKVVFSHHPSEECLNNLIQEMKELRDSWYPPRKAADPTREVFEAPAKLEGPATLSFPKPQSRVPQ